MEIYRKLSIFIILIQTPDFPHFYDRLGGNLGSLLYVDVSVMGLEAVILYDHTCINIFSGTSNVMTTSVTTILPFSLK